MHKCVCLHLCIFALSQGYFCPKVSLGSLYSPKSLCKMKVSQGNGGGQVEKACGTSTGKSVDKRYIPVSRDLRQLWGGIRQKTDPIFQGRGREYHTEQYDPSGCAL